MVKKNVGVGTAAQDGQDLGQDAVPTVRELCEVGRVREGSFWESAFWESVVASYNASQAVGDAYLPALNVSDVLALFRSLQKCGAGMMDHDYYRLAGEEDSGDGTNVGAMKKASSASREGVARGGHSNDTEEDRHAGAAFLPPPSATREDSVVQRLHRWVAGARFTSETASVMLPWGALIAFASVATAAGCIALLPLWLPCEAAFYVFMRRKRDALQRAPPPGPSGDLGTPQPDAERHLACIQRSLVKLVEGGRFPTLHRRFVSDWFLGADPHALTRADAEQFVSENFFFRGPNELTARERKRVSDLVRRMEGHFRHAALFGPQFRLRTCGGKTHETLKPGFNVCGPYPSQHYPWAAYVGIGLFKEAAGFLLNTMGFTKRHFAPLPESSPPTPKNARAQAHALAWVDAPHRPPSRGSCGTPSLTYWVRWGREGAEEGRGGRPIVLLHGIATGVSSYAICLKALAAAHPRSPIVVVEIPGVAMEAPWSRDWAADVAEDGFCDAMAALFDVLGFTQEGRGRPVLVGHSFGCFVARWLLRPRGTDGSHAHDELCVHGAVLLDPMTFLLPYPDISKRLATPPTNFYETMIRRIIMREPAVAYTLNRGGRWPRYCLWAEDLEALPSGFKVEVGLGARDLFFDAALVSAYLQGVTRVRHRVFNSTHGELILRPDLLKHVVGMVHRVM